MSIIEQVRKLSDNQEEAEIYEQVFTLTSWNLTIREVHSALSKAGYDLTVKRVEDISRRLRETVGKPDLQTLSDNELSGYLVKSFVLEKELDGIYLQSKHNWDQQNQGKYYTPDGNRTEPVSAKDLIKQIQAIEQIRRARLAVVAQMRNMEAIPINTGQSLPAADGVPLDAFSRKPEIIEGEIVKITKN